MTSKARSLLPISSAPRESQISVTTLTLSPAKRRVPAAGTNEGRDSETLPAGQPCRAQQRRFFFAI